MEEDQPRPTRTEQRGRKRNDALPPSRAREVQRAFRARRAAHLAALEERVKEVETENAELRIALNMPPANRPAIRSGPTGRGKVIDTPGSSNAKMDDYSGSESGSDGGTPDGGHKSGSRKRGPSSTHISRPASGQDNHANFNSPVPDMFRNSGLGSMPYGYNMFPGSFPGGSFPAGQRPFSPSMMSGAFPGASAPRPEELLQFQQQLSQHQHQLAQSFGSNGTSLPTPGSMFPGSPSASPFTAQYQHLAQQQAAYQALLQQQQLQQQQPTRPHSSNSHHSNDGGHPTFPLQNHHRQPTSQHSSPLASGGFPAYPGSQQTGQTAGGSINGSVFHPPSRSGTPSLQHNNSSAPRSGTPSGRIEIGSVQAYSIMDRLKACCKLDDQAVSSDPGLLAFCNDIVTALGAQPSDCLAAPSPLPPTPSPTASPSSHPSTPNPSAVLSAAQLNSTYLTIFNVWSVLRQSYPLPFEAAVRDAMEAGSKAAKALLKAASASTVKVEGWKGSKGSYGEKIVCRNTNGVEVECAFLDSYMATLNAVNGVNGLSVGGAAGGGGAVLGSWGAEDGKGESDPASVDGQSSGEP